MLKATTARALAALLGAAVFGPAARAQSPDPPAVRSQMLVSTDWLQRHLADSGLVILHVGRDRRQYDSGHIPGARFVALDELVQQRQNSLNELPSLADLQALFEHLGVGNDARIILYGESGGLLAARAFFTLDYLGHGDHAALLDGGLEKWTAESRPLTTQPAHPVPAHFTPHLHAKVLVTTALMRDLSHVVDSKSSAGYALLDARPRPEFDGAVPSEAVPKAGHIAGARSLYWKTLLRSGADPALLSEPDLRRAFTDAGAAPAKLVVTYCRTGMQSSFTYFVARYLGYRAAMYDGSVYEWVHAAGHELVVSPAGPAARK